MWNMKEKNINSIFEQFAAQFCGRTLRERRPQHVVLPSRTSVMEVWQQPAFAGANTSKYKQSPPMLAHWVAICICLESLRG